MAYNFGVKFFQNFAQLLPNSFRRAFFEIGATFGAEKDDTQKRMKRTSPKSCQKSDIMIVVTKRFHDIIVEGARCIRLLRPSNIMFLLNKKQLEYYC